MVPVGVCPVPLVRSLTALADEGAAVGEVLAHVDDAGWGTPTRLPAWSVRDLTAHLVRGVSRVSAYLAAPAPPAADVDWLGYWRAAADADPVAIAERAVDLAGRIPSASLAARWHQAVEAAVTAAEAEGPARLLPCPFGGVRLDHYLTSRVLEVVVHGLDLRAALGLEEVATPLGRAVTTAVLDGLLAVPRPVDLARDDVAYVLAATGRRPHPDPDLPVLR